MITWFDYKVVRHKPTGKVGMVVPEFYGLRCGSWSRVQVVVENGHGLVAQLILAQELEVIGEVDPEIIKRRFSLDFSENGESKNSPFRQSSSEADRYT